MISLDIMELSLETFLHAQRTDYIKCLEIIAAKLEDYWMEPLNGSPGYRHDIIVNIDGGHYEVIANTNPYTTKGAVYMLDGLHIRLESFVWNGCCIRFLDGKMDPRKLEDWCKKAIKPELDGRGKTFVNAIHSVKVERKWLAKTLVVDFGSAEVAEALRFFHILRENGVRKIGIKSQYI